MASGVLPQSPERRRALTTALILAVVLAAASFVIIGPFASGTAVLTGVLQRTLASLIGAAGIVAGLRAFHVGEQTGIRRVGTLTLSLSGSLLIWFLYIDRVGVRGAVHSVIIAMVASGALFVAANRWLDQVLVAWARFTAITGVVLGLLLGTVLVGNRSIGLFLGTAGSRVDRSVLLIGIVTLLGGAYGFIVGARDGRSRLLVGGLGGAFVGTVIGVFLRVGSLPTLDVFILLASTLTLSVIGALLARVRGRDLLRGALLGAAFGWLLGTFGFPELGSGTVAEGALATGVLGALVGIRLGLAPTRDMSDRLRLESRARAVIFLAPALTFISAALIIPTVRTVYLSLLDRRSAEFVGLDNFRFIFGQQSFYNPAGWREIFSSTEFVIFASALLIGLLLAFRQRRTIDGVTPPRLLTAAGGALLLLLGGLADRAGALGGAVGVWRFLAPILIVAIIGVLGWYASLNEGNSGFSGPGGAFVAVGVLFLTFAAFTNLRGTLMNNLWWVVMVTGTATGLGLAIAALADRSKGESVAKSIIFMPMAISFVGAGIIWRFMYLARPENRPQTGVLNAAWVGIGNMSVSPRATTSALILLAVAVLAVAFGVGALRAGSLGTGWTSVFIALFIGWIGARFLGGQGVAGVQLIDGVATVSPLLFISGTQQVGAYNNLFIMIPFIWIYTGFAMVIFSAAIKGVPTDLLEAGRVDGATEAQTFWRIVLPQIRPTIGVVLTTIIVVVMKVFDIVKVMTNGNFGTQVLANEMWNRAFLDGNFGVGSAVAAILFLSVLPVMYVNVRRMQKDAA